GTSELAREYAHRFGYCYDLIWWIPAHDQVAARATLRRLAELKVRSDTGDAMRAALDAVSSGEWFPRSLLIYDNVTDLAGMASLLPADGAVDVLVTGHDTHAEGGWGSIS